MPRHTHTHTSSSHHISKRSKTRDPEKEKRRGKDMKTDRLMTGGDGGGAEEGRKGWVGF